MKTYLCCLLIVACGTVPHQQEAQDGVAAFTQAIMNQNPQGVLASWMPEKRTDLGKTQEEQLVGAQKIIDQQIAMLTSDFKGKTPKVLSVTEGYQGSLEVTIELDGKPSSKHLQMWRDELTGKVYFAGRYPAHVDPATLGASGAVVWENRNDWLIKNYSSTNHHFSNGWATDSVGGFGTDAAHLSIAFKGCPTPTANPSCWTAGFHCCNVIHPDMVHDALQDQGTFGGGFNAYITMQCNHANQYAAVGLLSPNDNSAACTCPGSSWYSTTMPKPLCCYQSFFGSDIEWENYQNGTNDMPFCNSALCPGW